LVNPRQGFTNLPLIPSLAQLIPPPQLPEAPDTARGSHMMKQRNRWMVGLVAVLMVGGVMVLAKPGETAPARPLPSDPAITLEWTGPEIVKVNQPADYTLTVKNACAQTLHKVIVQVRVPKETTVKATKPESRSNDGVYLFELGTMDSNSTKTLTMNLQQATRGELQCQAWVTFTGTAAMKAQVKEPKLGVTIQAPAKAISGDKVAVEYVVTNTGDVTIDDVVLKLANSSTPPMAGKTLKPGEAHKMTDEFLATTSGTMVYEAVATGRDGLSGSAKASTLVQAPKIEVTMTGPEERPIGKKALYTINVRNCGDVPVTGLTVREYVPATFRVSASGAGGVVSTSGEQLQWTVGDLAAGAVKKLEFEGTCSAAGSLRHTVEAMADRKVKGTAEVTTKVEGIPALRMELVDSVDPVEKGAETVYEIKVTNTGTKADSNIVISCELPGEFEFVSCKGPTNGKHEMATAQSPKVKIPHAVVFEPISELPPKTEAVFRVTVKARGTGDVRFKTEMTSKHLSSPVKKEESTRLYGE
jgi:uncharacterized repeat protein (TIGR01451 family)